jgi:hypothetical protein
VTVAEIPQPGRAKPVLERFEISEAGLSAHLTEEQKSWPVVKLHRVSERFEVLTAQPTLVLKLSLAGTLSDADQVELAKDSVALLQALSDADRELGGGGLLLADQRAESGAVILTLRHAVAEGAEERAAKLTEMLKAAMSQAKVESADVAELLQTAAQSPAGRVNLLLAGSRTVARCEVLTAAA